MYVKVEIGAIDKFDPIQGVCFVRDGYNVAIEEVLSNRCKPLKVPVAHKFKNLHSYIVVDIMVRKVGRCLEMAEEMEGLRKRVRYRSRVVTKAMLPFLRH